MMQEQVRLPYRVAFEVVLQGIRIRFGRALITITGVIMGIAFLMSILCGQNLKKGVQEEDILRSEIRRIYNFLSAEMGPTTDRTVGVFCVGPMSPVERGLLGYLEDNGLSGVRWFSPRNIPYTDIFRRALIEKIDEENELGAGVSAVLVMGDGPLVDIDWENALQSARQRVVAYSRSWEITESEPHAKYTPVYLNRTLTDEEKESLATEKKRERFRNIWIITISLLVTVIGIANAMLMSVTERFREIGTMKCLGALSSFVRLMFLIESALIGIVGGITGYCIGLLFSIFAYGFTYGFPLIWLSLHNQFGALAMAFFIAISAGIFLSIVAAIYPASVASRMVPADALRSNV